MDHSLTASTPDEVVSDEERRKLIRDVVGECCIKLNVPLYTCDETNVERIRSSTDAGAGRCFKLKDYDCLLQAPLAGDFQVYNTALAVSATLNLFQQSIGREEIRKGLAQVRWPARLQILAEQPLLIFDAAHNAQAMKAVVQALNKMFAGQTVCLLLGILKDKDWRRVVEILLSNATFAIDIIYCAHPENERALPAFELAEYCRQLCKTQPDLYNVSDIVELSELKLALIALRNRQRQTGCSAFVGGSLYIADTVGNLVNSPAEEEASLWWNEESKNISR